MNPWIWAVRLGFATNRRCDGYLEYCLRADGRTRTGWKNQEQNDGPYSLSLVKLKLPEICNTLVINQIREKQVAVRRLK